MAVAGFWFLFYFIFPAVTLSVKSEAVLQDVRSDVDVDVDDDGGGGGLLAKSILLAPQLNVLGLNLPVPFQTWNLKAIESSFDLRLMNSSWSGPAETNIYRKGESIHLQVFALANPALELYIQSCYVTSSSSPMDKSRSALILNKGCVSSKQPMIEFISKQHDSINLLLDTSRLKFSQVYVHCSVVFSSAVTPDSKSCNYDQRKSRWVELGGETNVCKCCASKCKGPPSSGSSNEFKAFVSTGPLTLNEEQNEELSKSVNNTSQVGSSTGTKQTTSVIFPTSVKKSFVMAGTLSGKLKKLPYSSSWRSMSPSVVSESMMLINQDKGSTSMWIPGRSVDDMPDAVVEIIDVPQENSSAERVGVSIQDEQVESETRSEVRDWNSLIPESVSEVYVADSVDVMSDWGLGGDDALEGFSSPNEEQRDDVLLNYKWPQHHKNPGALASFLEKPQEKGHMMVLEQSENVVKDVLPKFLKKTKLTFSLGRDGSSSLSYEEDVRSPSVDGQEVKLEMEDDSSKKVKDLMQSLLDLVSDLSKMLRDQWRGPVYRSMRDLS